MYVYIYTYIYTHTQTLSLYMCRVKTVTGAILFSKMCMYISKHICMNTYLYIYTFNIKSTYVRCLHTDIYIYVYIHLYTLPVYMCACKLWRKRFHVYIFTYIYIYIYVHANTLRVYMCACRPCLGRFR